MGENHCDDCDHSFGIVHTPSYTLDGDGNRTWLDPESEARHKSTLAKAASKTSGIDVEQIRVALQQAHAYFVNMRKAAPWYRFDLRYRYSCYADAIRKFSGQFTG